MRPTLAIILAACLAACTTPIGPTPPRGAEVSLPSGAARSFSLTGSITGAQLATYVEVPFNVPPGADSLSISFDHDGRGAGATLDLGLRDPTGFRGWSGSNKSTIFIAANEATPSFRAGPVSPGTWTLLIGVPAIRADMTTHYEATVVLNGPSSLNAASGEPGWRRGDFHAHTGHSDASCANKHGLRAPCPVHETTASAERAGLDFLAVTDHNTFAQNNALRELAPFHPDLTLIPGAEITTFLGHANALGVHYPLDFQLGTARLPDIDTLIDQIEKQGGLLSINHPGLPSGPACMGCGWTAKTPWDRIAAIEVINGDGVRRNIHEGPLSGITYWQKLLDQGHRLIAIGGSDNHDPTDDAGVRQSPMGKPATVVWSDNSGDAAILAGVRSGRVFLDVGNVKDRLIDIEARIGDAVTPMGGQLRLAPGADAALFVTVAGVTDADGRQGVVTFVSGGLDVMQPAMLAADMQSTDMHSTERPSAHFSLKKDAQHGWIRADVRDASGRLLLLSNPIFVRAE